MPSSPIPTSAVDVSPFTASVTCQCQGLLFNMKHIYWRKMKPK